MKQTLSLNIHHRTRRKQVHKQRIWRKKRLADAKWECTIKFSGQVYTRETLVGEVD